MRDKAISEFSLKITSGDHSMRSFPFTLPTCDGQGNAEGKWEGDGDVTADKKSCENNDRTGNAGNSWILVARCSRPPGRRFFLPRPRSLGAASILASSRWLADARWTTGSRVGDGGGDDGCDNDGGGDGNDDNSDVREVDDAEVGGDDAGTSRKKKV